MSELLVIGFSCLLKVSGIFKGQTLLAFSVQPRLAVVLKTVRDLTHSRWMKTTAKWKRHCYFSVRSLGGKSKTVNILRTLAWFVTIRLVANKNLICTKQRVLCHKSFCGIVMHDPFFSILILT